MEINRQILNDLSSQQKKEIFELCLRNDFNVPDIWGVLYNQLYRPLVKKFNLTKRQIKQMDENITGRNQVYLANVLFRIENNKIVGFCIFEIPNAPQINPNTMCFISYLFVSPEFRRRGIGRELVKDAIEMYMVVKTTIKLMFQKEYELQLEVEEDNIPLIEFYKSAGFNIGERVRLNKKWHIKMLIN